MALCMGWWAGLELCPASRKPPVLCLPLGRWAIATDRWRWGSLFLGGLPNFLQKGLVDIRLLVMGIGTRLGLNGQFHPPLDQELVQAYPPSPRHITLFIPWGSPKSAPAPLLLNLCFEGFLVGRNSNSSRKLQALVCQGSCSACSICPILLDSLEPHTLCCLPAMAKAGTIPCWLGFYLKNAVEGH